jgi:hypothetical protein
VNPVFAICASLKLDPITAMNRLQDAGIVSDNCVSIGDIPPADQVKSEKFLFEYNENDEKPVAKPKPKRHDIFKF